MMDKVTRILRLYAQLAQGKRINKIQYCMEMECSGRTFDRDIEDIRLYLSDLFYEQELIYDRSERAYCLTNSRRYLLEKEEYFLIERLLLDSGLLSPEELLEMLLHVASNTERGKTLESHLNSQLAAYRHTKAGVIQFKLFSDLLKMIDQKKAIRFMYDEREGQAAEYEGIPKKILFADGTLKLLASCGQGLSRDMAFDLRNIHSFIVIETDNT